jgi:methylenetetrahydrofolate reductase (NADPH)
MKIVDTLVGSKKPRESFEFFPPKSESGEKSLFETVELLKPLDPLYVSVTYGAGGSTRRKTVELASRIRNETGVETMAHLTCVGHSRDELRDIVHSLKENGVQNVLPLRGDPPKGETEFVKHEEGFEFASELTEFIARDFDFCLAGACYPEKHQEAISLDADIEALKRKIDAGTHFLITQLFFDPQLYDRFMERMRKEGVDLPVVPGVMPVTNVGQIERFTKMCGASIPNELHEKLDAHRDDKAAVVEIGIEWATEQCRKMLESGAPGVHFYTLNRSHSTRVICERLTHQHGF